MRKQIIYKYELEENIKDNKRDFTIIDKEIRVRYKNNGDKCNEKWYKYTCNICSYNEGWIEESNLLKGNGCSCCRSFTIVKGINDINTTHPQLVKYFKNIEDVYTHSYSSNKKVWFKCPNCGFEKEMKISDFIKKGMACEKCSDSISYCEKFVFSVLEQLGINFQTQLSKTTFKWCQDYRYDFCFELNGEYILLETHGLQHYEEQKRGRSLKEEKKNDILKKQLAITNGIKEENYIEIDCRKSTLEWIRDNILESNLVKMFNLSKIDWVKAEKFTYTSLIKIACDYKNTNSDLTTTEIGELMGGYHKDCIRNWLRKGEKIGLCEYNAKEEKDKTLAIGRTKKRKPIMCIENGMIFESILDCEKQSLEIFGVKLLNGNISSVCNGKYKKYKGYTFKYIEEKEAC